MSKLISTKLSNNMVESLPKVETNLTDMVSKSNQRIIAISKWNRDQKATSRDR